MAGFNGGVYTRVHNWKNDRLADIAITDSRMDEEDDSIAAALSMCVLNDGTQTIRADISMSDHRITHLADPVLTPSVIGHHALNVQTADGRYVLATDAGGLMNGPLTIITTSYYALRVMPTASVTPALWVTCSQVDQSTGVLIQGQKPGDGVYVDANSTGANEALTLRSKGAGRATLVGLGGVVLDAGVADGSTGVITLSSRYSANMPAVDAGLGADLTGSILISNYKAAADADGGSGDAALAAIVFACAGKYGVKLALRADGVFGLGGYSAGTWKWSVNCLNGDMYATGRLNATAMTLSSTVPSITFTDTEWGTHHLTVYNETIGFMNAAQDKWMIQCNQGTLGMYCGGPITAAGDVSTLSDGRNKTGVETIDNALNLVRSMRGVHYTTLDKKEFKAGVIAQELQAIAPELVSATDKGVLSVAYGNLVAYLIEAIKQLDREIRGREPA